MPSWLGGLLAGLKAGRDLNELFGALPPYQRELIEREWQLDARADQKPPEGDWLVWLLLGGRGAGKTRAGAQWVRAIALGLPPFANERVERIALVGETFADVREVMIEGVSGLLALHESFDRPDWQPARRRIVWSNGTVAQAFSSEDPEGLRGPQFGAAWADGKPFNLRKVTYRLHHGNASQNPDSLIEAKQGEGKAPGYRDTAYIVFEHFPLEDFGNRVPIFSFEVIRPVGAVEEKIRGVTIIPGATEFGYSPTRVKQVLGPGRKVQLNCHVDGARSDWDYALDELTALCPNLERVGLVVAWFGNDLRANHCTLKPGVVDRDIDTEPESWQAAGLNRATARLVSRHLGKPAFGGTPSDQSVVAAIRDLNDRGLKVMFYPFIMMDIETGNGCDDPYGGDEQAAYPWRGSLTASIAPGLPARRTKRPMPLTRSTRSSAPHRRATSTSMATRWSIRGRTNGPFGASSCTTPISARRRAGSRRS
jgi:hypothetical protein